MKRILKMIGISIIVIVLLITVAVTLFINFYPAFGKSPSKAQKEVYAQADNYRNGKFVNQRPVAMDIQFLGLIKQMLKKAPNRKPKGDIPVMKIDSVEIANSADTLTRLTWFGHSTFLLEMDGMKILLDPMLGPAAAPHPLLGPNRYYKDLPIQIEKLPKVDAVILSHDHYDHLDYGSIRKLKDKVDRFYAPLGVSNHLEAWGVAPGKITSMNWWEETNLGSIKLVCAPARHFSGRGLFDRETTLWSSWVITGPKDNIYFSGDGGYDSHFKQIGEKFGPFDISLVECGQYYKDWKDIHMMPEETAQAAFDLQSKLAFPIHWGAFTLAFHDWIDPPQRMLKKAEELGVPVTTPAIGQTIVIGDDYPTDRWWENHVYDFTD